jgi:putative transposase
MQTFGPVNISWENHQRHAERKILGHIPPAFVGLEEYFFISLCCQQRGFDRLCLRFVSTTLLEDAIHCHCNGRWFLHLLLLMPDHLHLIAAFPNPKDKMSEVIRSWKRLTARQANIDWQKNYFDHRLRSVAELQLKTDYIRQNPVRANLAGHVEEWPHFVDLRMLQGR